MVVIPMIQCKRIININSKNYEAWLNENAARRR